MTRPGPFRIAIVSDIHYAGAAETARGHSMLDRIRSPFRRWLVRQQRHWLWLREPWAHNHFVQQFIREAAGADLIVANGDFSCDSAYVGVSDQAAFESADECLGQLRAAFGDKFLATIGDHELGKMMLGEKEGGLRLASHARAIGPLRLEPFWQRRIGRYVLVGITSSLIALPLYEAEALPGEWPQWCRLREQHIEELRNVFDSLQPSDRVLLFCHDPSALPFLREDRVIRRGLPQIERTIVGHLHSKWILRQARLMAGMPRLNGLGHTARRLSRALREARHWKEFHLLLCPSPPGLQLFKDGGYCTAELQPDGDAPAQFEVHRFAWGDVRPER
ncbi:MAG: hypothetical protein QOF48_77 [Verrucomicrobiota bacterium]